MVNRFTCCHGINHVTNFIKKNLRRYLNEVICFKLNIKL
uniref:Uncharacterized protein n=1 Tax=Tetranychus urticae TaxID=32264 RepID=T1KIZ2_TETUR